MPYIVVKKGDKRVNKNNNKRKSKVQEIEELLSLCCDDKREQIEASDGSPRILHQQPPRLLMDVRRNKLDITTSDNKRFKVDDAVRPVLLRYLATSHVQTHIVVKSSSSVELLHLQLAQELQVFFDSVIAILILDPSTAEQHLFGHHSDDVLTNLREALCTKTLFPVTSPSESLPSKLLKLEKCLDAASVTAKVSNQRLLVLLHH